MAQRDATLREVAVRFGREDSLCGVVSYPQGRREDAPGVLLLNAGMVHRVGPNRFYVNLARALAGHGFPVLRFDFSGVGDSEPRTDSLRFERSAVEESQAGMDLLADMGLSRLFVLAGLCNGAEMSFKTACADPRVLGLALINPQRYLTEPSRELVAHVEGRTEADFYWRTARFKPQSWFKFVRGRSDYRAVLRALGRKLGSLLGNDERVPAEHPDAAAFARLYRRGVRLLLLFSEGDPGMAYLGTIAGDRVAAWRASGQLGLEVIPGADHTLTPLASQDRVRQSIVRWILTVPRRLPDPQAPLSRA